jgi:RimJ/RimL family protein N-acetyltransferase
VGRAKAFLRAVLPPVVVSAVRRVRHRFRRRIALSPAEPPLSDGVIELRLIDERDIDTIRRAADDSEIRRRFGVLKAKPAEYFERYRELSRCGGGAAFAICDVGNGGFGLVTVERRDQGRAELGYWLLAEGRGRGRATRAVRLVSRWALSQPGIARLELSTAPDNKASQRVAQRSGFRREGVLRSYHVVNGRREDAVSFSLLPGDLDERTTHAPTIRASVASALTTGASLANDLCAVVQIAA